jgi:hypothetical protein
LAAVIRVNFSRPPRAPAMRLAFKVPLLVETMSLE